MHSISILRYAVLIMPSPKQACRYILYGTVCTSSGDTPSGCKSRCGLKESSVCNGIAPAQHHLATMDGTQFRCVESLSTLCGPHTPLLHKQVFHWLSVTVRYPVGGAIVPNTFFVSVRHSDASILTTRIHSNGAPHSSFVASYSNGYEQHNVVHQN